MMGWAIVNLRWTPVQFWEATPHEVYSAAEVFDARRAPGNKG